MAYVKSARNYFEKTVESFRTRFASDANDLILQCRTWQKHYVGATPGFNGDVERALRSITVPMLYMPSETDVYFPVSDARYEAAFIRGVTLKPIPSFWGHTAGRGSNPSPKPSTTSRGRRRGTPSRPR